MILMCDLTYSDRRIFASMTSLIRAMTQHCWLYHLQDRAMVPSGEWRSQIQQVDAGVLHHLRAEVTGGFDEERFGARVGFGNLKQ